MNKPYWNDGGSRAIEIADHVNIPVNCFLNSPGRHERYWVWEAENFCPRAGKNQGTYRVLAKSEAGIREALQEFVFPLYCAALENLKKHGTNYFWKPFTD